MFEAFVGSFLGVGSLLALLTLKDKVEAHRERKQQEVEKRMLDAYARTQRTKPSAW
jgi:hypothetical protein